MITLPGWSAVGAPVAASGGHLQRVHDRAGVPHLLLAFRAELADHPMLRQGMDPIAPFLKKPGVPGVAPLADWDRERAAFVYPAGDGVLLATILERLRAARRPGGARAALELLAAGAPILEEAVRAGRRVGLPAHGGLDPWRALVTPAPGQGVTFLGHGVPPVHVTTWLEDDGPAPGPGLRYTPPERLEDQDEDLRGDLYALAVLAGELLLGRPPIEADGRAAVDAILAGAAAAAIERSGAPAEVVALLAKACARDPKARFGSGRALAEKAAALAKQAEGPSLADLARGDAPAPPPVLEEDTAISYARSPATLRPAARPSSVPVSVAPAPPARPAAPVESDDTDPGDLASPPPRSSAPGAAVPPAGSRSAESLALRPMPLSPLPQLPAFGEGLESERTDVIGVPRELLEALGQRDPAAVPPPVPELPADPSLAHVQEHARRIVERTADLAARAQALCARVVERATADDQRPLVRAAQQGAERARKAAESAKTAANLLALDDDAAGAMITLDLVRNAELQCDTALADVTVQHRELERVAERVQAQARALQEAARRATEHADAATDAANQADDLVTVLEEEQREGLLTAPGTEEAVDAAVGSAERAHACAEQARAQAEHASGADRADLALRYAEQARRAEESALVGLQETREAAERARRIEAAARTAATTRAADRAAAARLHAEESWRALQRADEALKHASTAQSRQLRDVCAGHVRDAEAATSEADRALQGARATEQAREASRLAEVADRACARAEEAAREAAAASDRVVRTAGALAERRARVSKLQEEARGLAERSRTAAARARDEVDRLLDDTSRLSGAATAQGRAEALAAARATEEAMARLDELARQAAASSDVPQVEAALAPLRTEAAEVARLADLARDAVASAREASEAELVELQRREEARREVLRAASQAAELAGRCRALVDQAWARSRAVPAPLPGCAELEEVADLKARAVEIVDIAEFQAGEAAASADLAGQESDPAEARGHAQTASSFLDRITADLPEAIQLLDQADQLARRENEALTSARARTTELAAAVEQLVAEATSQAAAARRDVGEWAGTPAVDAAAQALEASLGAFEEDRNEAGWARDRCARATRASDGQELVPPAETALGRARDKKRRVDAHVEALRRAIGAAEAAAAAVQEARKNTRGALDALGADLSRVVPAEQRLKDAIARHGAGGPPSSAPGQGSHDLEVANAELRMREAVGTLRRIRHELEVVVDRAELAREPEEARDLAARALQLRVEAELAVEQAAEAEARGTAAAEQQARARVEAERRKLESAREAAAEQARRARDAVERIDAALDEAEEEGAATESEEARRRFEDAVRLGEQLRTAVNDVERAAEEARAAQSVESAAACAERARSLADRVIVEAGRAGQLVQQAQDLARAAAAEAQALESVRAEVRAMAVAADEAVERARDDALRILQLLRQAPRSELRALSEQANGAVQTATTAAAKVRAALPLAEQAEALPVAEATLRAARQATDRGVKAADLVRSLVEQATERVRQEKEALARALEEARARAAQPAQEAVAAVAKADAWVDAGRREWEEAGRPEGPKAALAALDQAARAVKRRAERAAELAQEAAGAPTQDQAEAAGREVRAEVDAALESARGTRAALDVLREQLQKLKAELASIAGLVAEAEDHAAAASQVADQAEATLRELEAVVEELGREPGAGVEQALETVRTCATNARFAAASAGGLVQRVRGSRSRADAERVVEEAHRALEDALDALERVVAAEGSCRAAIAAWQQAEKEAEERRQEQERREREASARSIAQAEEQRARDEEEARRRRDEERRAKFERRREERQGASVGPPPPAPSGAEPRATTPEPSRGRGTPPPAEPRATPAPASGRDELRELLRQGRPPAGAPDRAGPRPRRLGEAPGAAARRESQNPAAERVAGPPVPSSTDPGAATARNVRAWAPSRPAGSPSSGPLTSSLPRRARPERSGPTDLPAPPPPEASPPPPEPRVDTGSLESGKVDALLERLRRRNERE